MSKPTPNERRLIVAYLNARSQARRAETPGEEHTAQMALMMARGAALLYLRLQPETKRTRRLIKNLEQGRGTSYRKPPAEVETGYVPEHPDVLARAAQAEAGYNLRHAAIRAHKAQDVLAELFKRGGVTLREVAAVYEDAVRAKYSDQDKADLLKQGKALKNAKGEPSYPVDDLEDLHNAIQAVGLGGIDHDKIRKHVIDQAAKIPGGPALIPKTWNADGSLKKSA